MFEKEAEEYKERNTGIISLPTHEAYARGLEEGFQDGAEYGYNKANEWHDLRKDPNDLPKDFIRVLILTEEKNLYDVMYIPYEGFKDPDFSNWYTAIAWIEKKNVLPKEIE